MEPYPQYKDEPQRPFVIRLVISPLRKDEQLIREAPSFKTVS